MRRRDFIVAIGGAAALPVATLAQSAETMRRVGILTGVDPFGGIDAFKKGLVGAISDPRKALKTRASAPPSDAYSFADHFPAFNSASSTRRGAASQAFAACRITDL